MRAGLAGAGRWLVATFDARTVQFYGGVALVGYFGSWTAAGAVLVVHATVLPLLHRRGDA